MLQPPKIPNIPLLQGNTILSLRLMGIAEGKQKTWNYMRGYLYAANYNLSTLDRRFWLGCSVASPSLARHGRTLIDIDAARVKYPRVDCPRSMRKWCSMHCSPPMATVPSRLALPSLPDPPRTRHSDDHWPLIVLLQPLRGSKTNPATRNLLVGQTMRGYALGGSCSVTSLCAGSCSRS